MSKQLLESDRMAAGILPRGEYPASDMTIRERYAMAAMQAMLGSISHNPYQSSSVRELIVYDSFEVADLMIKKGDLK